ncbi:hypothetical protein Emed_001778 [Eimeria media]
MAVVSSTLAMGEGPECAEAGDANCQAGASDARDCQRLSWSSDFFPASHWTSGASSTISSGRCNSRDGSGRHADKPGPVAEIHAQPVSVPANETSEEASAHSTLPKAANVAHAEPFRECQESSEKTARSKMHPSAPSCTAANTVSKKNSKSPCENHQAGSTQAFTRASLVWGPLAVQETLSERQLCIEKRMMELRQQNRRRLQRRQQEAKLQQQERLKEQQAILLARRHRLKLASLWKERGMAAAARSPSFSKESNPQRQAHAAASVQNGSRNAEELLTALVISESIDLQQVDSGSDSGQCTAGGLVSGPAGYTHVNSGCQGLGASFSPFALCTSREDPSEETCSSFTAQEIRKLHALPAPFLHAPTGPIETDKSFVQGTPLKATNSAGSYLHLCLHQTTQWRAHSLNGDPASRPSPKALSVHEKLPKLRTPSATLGACRRREGSQQTHRTDRALHTDSTEVIRGAHSQSLKTSKTCSVIQHQVRRPMLRSEPTQSSIAPLCHRGPNVGSSVPILLRVANKLKSPKLAQGDSASKPPNVPRPPASTDPGEADGQRTRRNQQPNAIVVVSDYQLKKDLELKLQKHLAVQHGHALKYPGFTAIRAQADNQKLPAQAQGSMSSSPSQMRAQLLADNEASKASGEPTEVSTENSSIGSTFVRPQQLKGSHSSEQQPKIPMIKTRDACHELCTETLHKEAARERRIRSDAYEELVSGKDNQLLSPTHSETEQQETIGSDGGAGAQAASLQLVRVTRRTRDSLGAKSTDQAVLQPEHRIFRNASQPSHTASCSSRLKWQAAKEKPDKVLERADNCLTHSNAQFKCTASAEQQQGGKDSCMRSHRASEEAENGSGSPNPQEEKAVTYSTPSSAFECTSIEQARQWNPTFLAVQALEQAQRLEEKRLLLLEVSHHAVEKQAKNRRKELAFMQWLQQQHNQQKPHEAGDSSSCKDQQLQHQERIGLAHRDPTVREDAQAAVALSKEMDSAGSHMLQTSHCLQQAQLCQDSKGREVKQSFRRSCTAPPLLSPKSSPLRVAQRAANVAYAQHSGTTQASRSRMQSNAEKSKQVVGNHNVDKAHSRLMQQPDYEELLQQQQALVQQLLQQCFSDIPANHNQTKENEAAALEGGSQGPLWLFNALAHMQRRDVLQALQRLLLLRSKTGSQAAVSEDSLHRRQALMQRGDRQRKRRQHVPVKAASVGGPSAAQNGCPPSLPSSLHRVKAALPFLRLNETKSKRLPGYQLQQDINEKSVRNGQVAEEIASSHDEPSSTPELTQGLNDQQQLLAAAIIGPLLASMLRKNPPQQKHELGEQQQHVNQQVF